MVIDDEPSLLEALMDMIEYAGHEATTASSGVEALEILAARDKPLPDLIITDVVMPEIDGLRLYTKVRGDAALEKLPIIFMSASVHNGVEDLISATPRVLFLRKPFMLEDLIEYIQKALLPAAGN